jgi:hypothetical protein
MMDAARGVRIDEALIERLRTITAAIRAKRDGAAQVGRANARGHEAIDMLSGNAVALLATILQARRDLDVYAQGESRKRFRSNVAAKRLGLDRGLDYIARTFAKPARPKTHATDKQRAEATELTNRWHRLARSPSGVAVVLEEWVDVLERDGDAERRNAVHSLVDLLVDDMAVLAQDVDTFEIVRDDMLASVNAARMSPYTGEGAHELASAAISRIRARVRQLDRILRPAEDATDETFATGVAASVDKLERRLRVRDGKGKTVPLIADSTNEEDAVGLNGHIVEAAAIAEHMREYANRDATGNRFFGTTAEATT